MQKFQERESLLEINRAVQKMAHPDNLGDVAQVFYRQLAKLGFDFLVLAIHRLLDESGQRFETYKVVNAEIFEREVQHHSQAYAIWKTGEVRYRRDLEADLEDLRSDFHKKTQADYGQTICSTLSVPLSRGIMTVMSTRREAFSEHNVQFVEEMAGILSVGLQRVEDLERAEVQIRQTQGLLKISQAVQEMTHPSELGQVAQTCLQAIREIGLKAHAMAIHRIIDPDEDVIETVRVNDAGLIGRSEQRTGKTLVSFWRDGVTRYEPDFTRNGEEETRYFRAKFGNMPICSFIDVPFSRGVISAQSTETYAFSQADGEALRQVAEIFSVGIARVEDMEALAAQYQELKESEARYRNLIRLADCVAYACDWTTRQYVYMDKSIKDMIGYGADELTPDLLESLFEEEIRLAKDEALPEDILLTGDRPPTVFRAEYRLKTRDGRDIWIADYAIEFRNEYGRLVYALGMLQDITERRLLEERMQQSQKLEAVGQLAGGVAHDFNNILTAIMGISSLVLTQIAKDDPIRADIEDIRQAGERAARLTEQLLVFSRKQVIQPRLLDLNGVVSDMQNMLRRILREDIELVVSMKTLAGSVRADSGHLEQVIMNLAVNAQDAMPEGGTLFIETDMVRLNAIDVGHMDIEPGDYVRLSMRDTGVGMDAETQVHIFEPFFTTKEPGQGTGMGLATVYGIVKQSSGHIEVNSTSGSGTVFMVYLPRIDRMPDEDSKTDTPCLPKGSETILIVEDEEMVRRFAQRTLRDLGYEVLVTRNGWDAIERWENYKGRIDLLLTDVVMPGMGGKELAERLLAKQPDLKVMLMSGYADQMGEGKAFVPDVAFLQKPFDMMDLAEKVRQTLDGQGRSRS